ncbi:MAG: hypothetical protein ACXAC8_15570 [Candidatus Hodarchaeales archaeon]|jgi:hypothetical protein
MSDLNQFLPKERKKKTAPSPKHQKMRPRIIDRKKSPLSLDQLSKKQIIDLLEPLMAEISGFAANLAWTRQKVLVKNPSIHPEELAHELEIPLLEAYLILRRLQSDQD